MDTLLNFFYAHAVLSVAFFLILVTIILVEVRDQMAGPSRIEPRDLSRLMNQEKALVVDIREAKAFGRGHIAGTKHASRESLSAKHQLFSKAGTKPIVILDNNGREASQVALALKKQGLAKVYLLKGGIAAWQAENLPLVKR